MAETVVEFIDEALTRNAANPGFRFRTKTSWKTVTFADGQKEIASVGGGLRSLGLGAADRIAILSDPRYEWTIADYAILGGGSVVVPIYQTNSPTECEFILRNSKTRAVITENAGQLAKIAEIRSELPDLQHVIVIDPDGADLAAAGSGVISWDDLKALATDSSKAEWKAAGAETKRHDLATLIYTSGTTGAPKGCMLTHDNLLHSIEVVEATGVLAPGDRIALFLPLAHILARVIQMCSTRLGVEIGYTSIATLMDDLADIQPTILPAVPRVFEKAHTRIRGQFDAATGAKGKLVHWALRVGTLRSKYVTRGRKVPPVLAAQHALAHKLVFSKVHARFGGQLRLCVSGGAPLTREVHEFFLAVGLTICEGYGLTEGTPLTLNMPDNLRVGSVGQPLTGIEVITAEDGELLARGRLIFQGYYENEEATAETKDSDGWLHTGDIGKVDRDGFVYITDRKKEIIITAGGKNVAPQPIEGMLKATPLISQALVYGDRKPYISALLAVDPLDLEGFAAEHKLSNDVFELISTPQFLDAIKASIEHVNADLGQAYKIKKYRILPLDFTQPTGELTPSLKLKRKVVSERYSKWIDEMYESGAPDAAAVTDREILDLQTQVAGV
jgi:long-chain acyl-CoA synthetase